MVAPDVSLKEVSFHEDAVLMVQNQDGQLSIPIKRLCENLGIDLQTQFVKIKSDPRFSYRYCPITGPDGKRYRMLCLPLDQLSGWLFTINPNKVKPAIRPKLLLYQRECVKALDEYWRQGEASRRQVDLAPWTVALKRRDLHQLRDLMATKDPRYNRMARRIIQDLLDGREPDFYQEFPEPDRHLLNRDNCFHSEAWKLLEEWSGAPILDTDTQARLETAKNEIKYTALTVSLSQTFFEMVLKALRNYEGGLQEMPLSMKSLI